MQGLITPRPHTMSPYGGARSTARTRFSAGLVAFLTVVSSELTPAQAGPNFFSAKQDVELGRAAAEEVERTKPILRGSRYERRVQSIVSRLSRHAPGARYSYRARVIDDRELNAFALPGGFLYVNRGLIDNATEGELAGVIAHEMAHIGLRHGTQQASRGLLAQAGLEILGGLAGRRDRDTGNIVKGVGGLGANVLFLKYSRGAETDADVAGARMMARAGYDPMDMARFFEKLRAKAGRDPGKVERFLSSHPAPAERTARIRQEARRLGSS
jgi:beta-barrel assembly-enhancing protease